MGDVGEGPLQPDRAAIGSAIRSEGFGMVYQPIVHLDTGELVGVEALCRCHDGTPADAWFDACERVGLASEMDAAVIELVLRDLPRLPDGYVAVNLSATTLATASPRLLDLVGQAVRQRHLVLELTEHAAVDDYPATTASIAALREAGVLFAVDDAGAGHSTFRHIVRLRPDIIKLDRSITQRIDADPTRQALVGSIVIFAGEVGAVVVAEGIETPAELATVRAAGVSRGQGYGLARPQPLPLAELDYEPVPFLDLVAGRSSASRVIGEGGRSVGPSQAAHRMQAVIASMQNVVSTLRRSDGRMSTEQFRGLTGALARQVEQINTDLEDLVTFTGLTESSSVD